LQAEDCKVFKGFRLVHHLIETIRVVKRASWHLRTRVSLHFALLHITRVHSLFLEIWGFKDLGAVKDTSFNSVGRTLNLQSPLFNLLRPSNHGVKIADRLYAVVGLLEEAHSHGSHNSLVFTDALRDANQCAKFWWQVDVLPFLLNFE